MLNTVGLIIDVRLYITSPQSPTVSNSGWRSSSVLHPSLVSTGSRNTTDLNMAETGVPKRTMWASQLVEVCHLLPPVSK